MKEQVLEPWLPGETPAVQMLWLALSYAEGAVVLSEALREDDFVQQYTSALVVMHLCRHAVELFLKGAIGKKHGVTPTGHRLDVLYEHYRSYYPAEKYALEVPPFLRPALEKDDGLFPGALSEFQKTHDQRYRYPTDLSGKALDRRGEDFDISLYIRTVSDLRQKLNTLLVQIEIVQEA